MNRGQNYSCRASGYGAAPYWKEKPQKCGQGWRRPGGGAVAPRRPPSTTTWASSAFISTRTSYSGDSVPLPPGKRTAVSTAYISSRTEDPSSAAPRPVLSSGFSPPGTQSALGLPAESVTPNTQAGLQGRGSGVDPAPPGTGKWGGGVASHGCGVHHCATTPKRLWSSES